MRHVPPMHILVVEDEVTSRKVMRFVLEQHGGHTVDEARTAEEAQTLLDGGAYDLALLDLNLPGVDGYRFCTRTRAASNLPIVMISGRGDVPSRVRGLQLGADDYVAKPFDPLELVARVNAVLRRSWRAPRIRNDGLMVVGELMLHLAEHDIQVRRPGVPARTVHFTPTEFKLLLALAREPGRGFTRAELEASVWGAANAGGAGASGSTSLTALVADVRARLEVEPRRPRYVVTVRNVGYKLQP